jgi:ABC-type multidrug transport system ATPase subunit
LDAHAALAVMKYLQTLAYQGHTIISTIHQPRQEIFEAFDKVLPRNLTLAERV